MLMYLMFFIVSYAFFQQSALLHAELNQDAYNQMLNFNHTLTLLNEDFSWGTSLSLHLQYLI